MDKMDNDIEEDINQKQKIDAENDIMKCYINDKYESDSDSNDSIFSINL